MDTVRRKMTLADWGITATGLTVGLFAGLIVVGMIIVLYSGLWMLVILALPLLLFQLLFEGMLAGLVALWQRWRGHTPEPVQSNQPAVIPWLRRYSFSIGFVIGVVYGLATMLLL
jgi:hypothetical protein